MSQTFFEKWKHRFSSAWDVLTGRAYACYSYENPMAGLGIGRKPWPEGFPHE